MNKKDVTAFIEEELQSLGKTKDEHPPDEEYNSRFVIPDAKLDIEEKIIDELLASVPQGQGYYLKLYKETRPNDFEFKLRIDNYENWSDLEYEIANTVKQYTVKSPNKWGTGHYRVVVWRDGGIRGQKNKPIDFYIDAGEFESTNMPNTPTGFSGVQDFAQFGEMLKTMRAVNPTVDPADIAKMNADAYQSGLKAAGDRAATESSGTAMIMTGMMTMMTELLKSRDNSNQNKLEPIDPTKSLTDILANLKSLGFIGKEEKPKSIVETLTELTALGLVKKPGDEDPLKKLAEIKDYVELFKSFSGSGNDGSPPDITSKIIDIVGNKIDGVLNTANKYLDAKKNMDSFRTSSHKLPISESINEFPTPQPLPDDGISRKVVNEHNSSPANNPALTNDIPSSSSSALDDIFNIVTNSNIHKFELLTSRINELTSGFIDAEQYVLSGKFNTQIVYNTLVQYGGQRFAELGFLNKFNSYMPQYIQYIIVKHDKRTILPSPVNLNSGNGNGNNKNNDTIKSSIFHVKCQLCNSIFDLDSEQEFNEELDKTCGEIINGIECSGILEPISIQPNTIPIQIPAIH